MKWDRVFLLAYLLWIAGIAGITVLLGWIGLLNESRYVLAALFLAGSLCTVIGYARYMPAGPTMPALLALSIVKSTAFVAMGIAFIVLGLGPGAAVSATVDLLAVYGFFGAAAGAVFFTGVYVLVGAGRGWISAEVYKSPFSKAAYWHDRKEKRG